MDDSATPDLKQQFALALLTFVGDATKAAERVAPGNAYYAKYMAEHWPNDPYVIRAKKELIDEYGDDFFLPSKYDLGRKLTVIMDTCPDPTSKLRAIELYARIFSHLQPNGAINVNSNNVTTNKVMLVRDYGSDDQWEERALAQQRQLQIDAG